MSAYEGEHTIFGLLGGYLFKTFTFAFNSEIWGSDPCLGEQGSV
jgi:hypothetical protein